MREYKFRGYATEEMVNSQWLYGSGIHVLVYTDEYAKEKGIKEEVFLFTDSGWTQVEKESVGQYAGLTDENGREIYEGDMVAGKRNSHWHDGYDRVEAKVYFSSSILGYAVDGVGGGSLNDIENIEVIGNTFEDYTLLKTE